MTQITQREVPQWKPAEGHFPKERPLSVATKTYLLFGYITNLLVCNKELHHRRHPFLCNIDQTTADSRHHKS